MNEKQLPEKIIVYRDGVGAGDIARLKDTEVAALRVIMNRNGLWEDRTRFWQLFVWPE